MKLLTGLVFGMCMLGMNAQAESFPHAARALAANCFQCHGTDGEASSGMPSLKGMPKQALIAMMQSRQQRETSHHIMNVHAQGYTDAEFDLIADYFSQLQ